MMRTGRFSADAEPSASSGMEGAVFKSFVAGFKMENDVSSPQPSACLVTTPWFAQHSMNMFFPARTK
jgi:hypothetical protein